MGASQGFSLNRADHSLSPHPRKTPRKSLLAKSLFPVVSQSQAGAKPAQKPLPLEVTPPSASLHLQGHSACVCGESRWRNLALSSGSCWCQPLTSPLGLGVQWMGGQLWAPILLNPFPSSRTGMILHLTGGWEAMTPR